MLVGVISIGTVIVSIIYGIKNYTCSYRGIYIIKGKDLLNAACFYYAGLYWKSIFENNNYAIIGRAGEMAEWLKVHNWIRVFQIESDKL